MEAEKTTGNSNTVWSLTTFGGFQITPAPHSKFRTRKTEQLFTLLALRPGTFFSRDNLAFYFWPDDPQESARQSVRMAVSNIRTVLGKDILISEREQTAVNPRFLVSDLADFEAQLSSARENPANALHHRQTAFNLSQHPWLPGFDQDWVTGETPRIQELIAENALALIQLTKAENHQESIRIAQQALSVVGCREDLHIALMQIYIDAGLTSLAIAQFETLEKQLDDLWGEPPSEAAVQVIESAPRATRLPRKSQETLPIQGLYGRESEIQSLVDLLSIASQPAFITLTGPGGSGKTSLAVAVGKILETQGQTVHFIDLTRDTTLISAAETIIQALNIPNIDSGEAIPAIARTFSQSNGLFILDNLEQLGEDATTLLTKIQSLAPTSRILATSRQAIQSLSQTRLNIQPLPVPPPNSPLAELRLNAAAQLFEIQAKLVNPQFEISARNAESIAELCRRLDGLPLAIKLAAARTVIRTPAQILAELNTNLEPIGKHSANGPDRHRNIFATTEWSLSLLSDSSRQFALQMSIYSGRFTELTATSLCPDLPVAECLSELIGSSLLNINSDSNPAEFWFFETVRTALSSQLLSSKGAEPAFESLLKFSLETSQQINQEIGLEAWQRLRLHYQNLENSLTALEYLVKEGVYTPSVAQLAISTNKILNTLNSERIAPILAKLYDVAKTEFDAELQARIGIEYARTIANRGDANLQLKILEECHELARPFPETYIHAQYTLGAQYKTFGQYQQAIDLLDQALARANPSDHPSLAQYNYSQGLNYGCINERSRSFEFFTRALPHARKAKDVNLIVRILFDLGSEHAFRGEGDQAINCFLEAEAICETVGSRKLEGLTRWQHGDALLDLGRPQEALVQIQKSIKLVYEGQYPAAQKWIFIKAGQAALACGQPELACKLLAKGKHIRESENRTLAHYELEYIDKTNRALLDLLGAEAHKKLQVQGQSAEWDNLWTDFLAITPQ